MPKPRGHIKTLIAAFILFTLGWILFLPASFSLETKKIVILLSGDMQPYRDALAGFKDELAAGRYTVTYSEFLMGRDAKGNAELKEKITLSGPDLIFTVGTPASLFAKENFKDIPVVFSMVLNPVENGVAASMDRPDGNIYGVSLNIPVEAQFRTLKRIKPDIDTIGMLYDAKTMAAAADEAEKAAAKIGVRLIAEPVSSEKEISKVLDRVLANSDCLWAGPDPLVYNPSTAQQIILATLKNNVPFMSFSKNFVKAGALAALECDYFDIGGQAGGITVKIIGRKEGAGSWAEFPRKSILLINKRTADTLGLRIDKSVLAEAEILGQ